VVFLVVHSVDNGSKIDFFHDICNANFGCERFIGLMQGLFDEICVHSVEQSLYSKGMSLLFRTIENRKKLIARLSKWVILGLLFLLARWIMPDIQAYFFLIWNLFLATMPLFLSSLLKTAVKENRSKYVLWMLGVLWLLFFPNAPYVLTDFVHFNNSNAQYMVLDFITLGYFSILSFLLGIISLLDVSEVLSKWMSKALVNLSVVSICLLAGIGIYLGRDLRFNSWDVFVRPYEIVRDSVRRLAYIEYDLITWTAASFISLLMIGCYFFGKRLRRI
jgi:uncharacterized membrane protein